MQAPVRLVVTNVVLLLLLAACSGQPPATGPLEDVTVQLAWTHQAQFAGLYVADQKGWYAEEGLRVTLVPRADPTADILAPLVEGTAQFGIVDAMVPIRAGAAGKKVVAIAAVYQHHPMVFMTLADSGITGPQDFPGHTLRALTPGSTGDIALRGIMARLELDSADVTQVKTGYDMAPFFAREVDIWAGYITNEVLTVRQKGYPVNLVIPDDYGVRLYGDTLVTSDRLIKEKPDLVLRFLRATLRGWRWAVENPEEAGPLALKYDPGLDAAQQGAIMEASVPLIHTGLHPIGWMEPAVWREMLTLLAAQELLTAPVELGDVFTMRFLDQVYAGEQKP